MRVRSEILPYSVYGFGMLTLSRSDQGEKEISCYDLTQVSLSISEQESD